jgi:hypothetical protein
MPSLACANCGTELSEPAYVQIIYAPRMSSGPVPNIAWLCERCYDAFPPAAKATWQRHEREALRKGGWFNVIRQRLTERSTSKSRRSER